MGDPAQHLAQDQVSDWVARFAPLLPPGPVLDLACGGGRHSRLFAALGHPVTAVDRSAEALQQAAGTGIETRSLDLELPLDEAQRQPGWPLSPQHGEPWSGIVVTNYLHRPLFPLLFASLAEEGVLLYETFALGNARHGKPSNPAFLLQPGELLALAAQAGSDFHVLAYEDGTVERPRPARVQRIAVLRSKSGGERLLNGAS